MTTRTLYNNTDEAWKVQFEGGSLPGLTGASRNQLGNWTGTVPANQTCNLEFDNNSGQIWLTSAKGTNWNYRFSTNDFDADPSWDHDGDTQGCNLNSPANGDFQIEQDVPQGRLSSGGPATMDLTS
jgi:nitrous oxidase accessory protein NosD